jgi:hypothetical protein
VYQHQQGLELKMKPEIKNAVIGGIAGKSL